MKQKRKAPSPGSVVARRFRLRYSAGMGGMGEVFRALDEENGEEVAVKLLLADATALDVERFAREARIMSEIRHPRIVSYVTHGVCELHGPYLVMVWLEGEDLAQRLSRGPLSTGEALLVLRRIAEPLALLHARSLVHRDLKPSNVLLENDDYDRATLLDLGITRPVGPSSPITAAGKCVGTPEYMSPEQVSGTMPIEPSSDVFSLGCILYECLTGQMPFTSAALLTLLSKIMNEPPIPLLSLRPGIPKAVAALVDRMLEKDPKKRPANASLLLAELRSSFDWDQQKGAFSPTIARDTPLLLTILCAKVPSSLPEALIESQKARLAEQGAMVHQAGSDVLFATFSLIGTGATDQVAVAARAGLALALHWPGTSIALATGLGLMAGALPTGEVADRARQAASVVDGPLGLVQTDELTASLLDGRFQTMRIKDALCLDPDNCPRSSELVMVSSAARTPTYSAVHSSVRSSVRSWRGKPSPYLGRAFELNLLHEAFQDAKQNHRARAFFITAPPGMGKSRLLEELVKRLTKTGENFLFMAGHGEPLGRSRPYAMLRGAFASPVSPSAYVPEREVVLECLADLAARERSGTKRVVEYRFTRGQLERAFLDLLAAECSQRPVIFVIEDVHHVDEPSLLLLSRALSELHSRSFLLLALGQADPMELHPCPIQGPVEQLELGPLPREAAVELVQVGLGLKVPEAVVAEIVERAEGNAFFLEELIRARAEGQTDNLPQSLVANLQARLGRLHPESRRVLVAASIFGTHFFRGGIFSVLNDEWDERAVDAALDALQRAGLIEGCVGRRMPGDEEYVFRQALAREAAYRLLTEEERALGHARAAAFLEAQGFEDAAVLAEHYQRAGNVQRARTLHIRAARIAFETNDFAGTRTHAEMAAALGAEGAELGIVRALTSAALFWAREWSLACKAGLEALPSLSKGSAWHCLVLGHLCVTTGTGIRSELFPTLFEELYTTHPDEEATSAYVVSLGRILCLVSQSFDWVRAKKVLLRLRELFNTRVMVDANAHGWMRFSTYEYGHSLGQEPAQILDLIEDAVRAFEESGDERMHTLSIGRWGEALAAIGRHEEALLKLREAYETACRLGESYITMATRSLLLTFFIERADAASIAEAEKLAAALLEDGGLGSFDVGFSRGLLARLALLQGNTDEALLQTEMALALMPRLGLRKVFVVATRLRALLRVERVEEAVSLAREMLASIKAHGFPHVGPFDVELHTAMAEVFRAKGERESFEAELQAALTTIGQQILDVATDEEQARLMYQVPANASAARLAKEHYGVSSLPVV